MAKRRFDVYRYWKVERCSRVEVEAETVEEAARLAHEDDDRSDVVQVDAESSPEVGRIIEITNSGEEIEHDVPESERFER